MGVAMNNSISKKEIQSKVYSGQEVTLEELAQLDLTDQVAYHLGKKCEVGISHNTNDLPSVKKYNSEKGLAGFADNRSIALFSQAKKWTP